uniref:Uncharacterized protein n=1 Tax=Ditylenchus dipsaci TaxID=166011 RepID=A0A915EB02_9BILA
MKTNPNFAGFQTNSSQRPCARGGNSSSNSFEGIASSYMQDTGVQPNFNPVGFQQHPQQHNPAQQHFSYTNNKSPYQSSHHQQQHNQSRSPYQQPQAALANHHFGMPSPTDANHTITPTTIVVATTRLSCTLATTPVPVSMRA